MIDHLFINEVSSNEIDFWIVTHVVPENINNE